MNPVELAALRLAERRPFYACLLTRLRRRYDEALPACAAVTVAPLALVVNPALFGTLTPRQQQGVLEHEVNHLLLRHFTRRKPDPLRWNIATDLAVNDAIVGCSLQKKEEMLPQGVPLPADFDLPPGHPAEVYYDALTQDQVGQAQSCQLEAPVDTHEYWTIPPSVSEILLDHEVQHLIKATVAQVGWGNTPGKFREGLALDRLPAQLRWQQALRQLGHVATGALLRPTRKRRSRRYGQPPGLRLVPKTALWVALDVSGSIGVAALTKFNAELVYLHRQGVALQIIEFDAGVQRTYLFRKELTTVAGRGGTDIRAPFKWLAHRQVRPQGVVVFTDGCGRAPAVAPPYRVLFGLTPEGRRPCNWGQAATLR